MSDTAIVVCLRVRDAHERVRGSVVRPCCECRRPVFVSPASAGIASRYLCVPCYRRTVAPTEHRLQPPTGAQLAELVDHLRRRATAAPQE